MAETVQKRLEIGPGDCPLAGQWDTLDAYPRVPITYKARWGYEPLPIQDNTYDLVFSSHAIEHIPWYQTIDALKEVHRILKPNGVFEVWTVDFEVIVKSYITSRWVDDWDCGGRIKNQMQSLAGRVFAYEKEDNDYNWHKALFDRPYLKECLTEAGFSYAGDLKKTRGHDHGVINLGVLAKK